jgi:hypothetical protein
MSVFCSATAEATDVGEKAPDAMISEEVSGDVDSTAVPAGQVKPIRETLSGSIAANRHWVTDDLASILIRFGAGEQTGVEGSTVAPEAARAFP